MSGPRSRTGIKLTEKRISSDIVKSPMFKHITHWSFATNSRIMTHSLKISFGIM